MNGMGSILKPIDVQSWVEPPGDQGMSDATGGATAPYAFLVGNPRNTPDIFLHFCWGCFLTQMKFDNMTTKQQANIELFFFSKSTIKM